MSCAVTMLGIVSVRSYASDAPEGIWRGPWYLGMTSGTAELQIEGGPGGYRGFLRMTNNESFGPEARPLASIDSSDGVLRFKVVGEDGKPLAAELPIQSGKGASLKGFARYGGFKLRLELVRAPAN